MRSNPLRIAALALAAGLLVSLSPAPGAGISSSQAQQFPPLSIAKIRGDLYLVRGGSGANSGVYLGKSVYIIDAKMSPESAQAMLEQVKFITSLPMTTVILTHSDGDHVNGLPGFPPGLEIIAQEQTKMDMEKAVAATPALKDYLPMMTFTDEMILRDGAVTIVLRHYGPAHTSGDAVVYFPDERAAMVGDLVFIGRDPLIHRQKGGSSFGLVKTLKAILAAEPRIEIFIPGHGEPVHRSDLEDLIASVQEKQAKIKALIGEGKSLDEIKKEFGFEERPGEAGARRFPSLIEVVYLELTEKK